MGAHFWSYHVPYREDLGAALTELREREFQAGRFFQPSEVQAGFFRRMFGTPMVKPKRPETIREAVKISGATGTRSILDMERVSYARDYGVASLLTPDELQEIFGTFKPTREMVESCPELELERGHGICVITYRAEKPDGIYFAGYSFD